MKNKTKQAFSLVELSVSIVFLGMMLLGIATITVRIMKIYQKGLAVRNVNTVGRQIIEDLDKYVGSSRRLDGFNPDCVNQGVYNCTIKEEDIVVSNNSGYSLLYGNFLSINSFYDLLNNNGSDADNAGRKNTYQASGVFCTGDYTYAWNTAQSIRELRVANLSDVELQNNITARNIISNKTEGTNGALRLVRVNGSICGEIAEKASDGTLELLVHDSQEIWDKINSMHPVDIISRQDGDMDLALYDFRLVSAAQNELTKEIIYNFSMTLGTVEGGVDIMSNGDYCKKESRSFYNNVSGVGRQTSADAIGTQYCAINKFNFTVIQKGEASL